MYGGSNKIMEGNKFSEKFDVRKSVYHHTIQINQPTIYNNSFTSLLLDVYVWLNTCQTTTNNAPTATLQR